MSVFDRRAWTLALACAWPIGAGAAESLGPLLMRTARGPSADMLRLRARSLDAEGYYFAALRDRLALLPMGKMRVDDLESVGAAALALGRFENIAATAAELRRRGDGLNEWPAAFRAAMAAFNFRLGQVERAAAVLPEPAQLARIALPGARARALLVAAAIRAAQKRVPEAIQLLEAVPGDAASEAGSLARLQRARLEYELGRNGDALAQLSTVPKSSPHWYDGVNVAAWAAYRVQDDNLALGQVMSLNSPQLESKFNPESHILEAASLYRLCHYESALRALRRLRVKYSKFTSVIRRFRQEQGERFATVSLLLNYVRGQVEAPAGYTEAEWKLLVDGVLDSEGFAQADRMLVQIKNEQTGLESLLGANPNRWVRQLAEQYRAELEAGRREAYGLALRAVQRRLREMERDVATNLESALAVEVEVNTRIRDRLQSGAVARMKDVDFEAEVRKGFEFWPFEGEYWRDEVGGYAFATTDVCGGNAK